MQVLRTLKDLSNFLDANGPDKGCLADTNFLFGLSYKDDRLFERTNDLHDLLVEYEVPIYANVISRMELIDLIFRKQVTDGCVQLFNAATTHSYEKSIYKILKDIRDKDTRGRREQEIYKVDEWRLKQLRKLISNEYGLNDWKDFCAKFVGEMLSNEWTAIEEDLGLNYVEIMEGHVSDLFNAPVNWKDMVETMGNNGLRGPDAMIVNLFSKSNFSVLVTSDSDLESCFSATHTNKAIMIL